MYSMLLWLRYPVLCVSNRAPSLFQDFICVRTWISALEDNFCVCLCVFFLLATFTSPVGDIFIDTSFDYCSCCCCYCWNGNFIDTLVRRQSNFMKVNKIFKRIVYYLYDCVCVSWEHHNVWTVWCRTEKSCPRGPCRQSYIEDVTNISSVQQKMITPVDICCSF